MARFAVVDVANLFHRVRHVVHGDTYMKIGMTFHTVFRSLRKLYRDQECDHIVLCLEGRSWRYEVYPQYKAKRKLVQAEARLKDAEEDEAFFAAMDEFVNFMAEKTRVTVLQSPGIEGDDFVARWIQLHPEDEHVILSGDTDFIQLLAPNVSIFNGVDQRLIKITGVFDENGEALVFHVDGSSGKLKIGKSVEKARLEHEKEQRELERVHKREEKERAEKWAIAEKAKRAENPEYKPRPYVGKTYGWKEFDFQIEPDWWKKALFLKIVRGDTGDGIFSANPGVRYSGSSKNVTITEAWEDRHSMGYHWNNFMLHTWDKAVGQEEDGTPIKTKVRVLDEFRMNEMLIDLTKQPDEVKLLMDTVIVQAVQKESVGNVGLHFLKFCNKYELNNLAREANDHAKYLMRGYAVND